MRCLPFACAALLALGACQSPSGLADFQPAALFERSASAPMNIVSIGGRLPLGELGFPDEWYAMTAQKDANGEVSGHINVRRLDGTTSFTGDVTCLQVQGNMAWIGVHITQSTATSGAFSEGGNFWFRAQDNGEGANAAADLISSLNPNGGSARCNERRTGLPLAWELQGNVQVR